MAITLSESAARHIEKQLGKRGRGIGLRLGVKRVGCSGFAYTMDYADQIGDNDVLFESHQAKVIVDRDALAYLDGTVVDFRREGLSESFKFDNPNVSATCGCGESFSIDKSAGAVA
ncbi:MAG: iron-sulfur cluster assembly accessory protein [Betaproteobacteria bacterium]|nr:MAG: iron-sulfur cluster assembly accessory protein [Betaproteobacteria bacterium]